MSRRPNSSNASSSQSANDSDGDSSGEHEFADEDLENLSSQSQSQASDSSRSASAGGKKSRKPNANWRDPARSNFLLDCVYEAKTKGAGFLCEKHLTERGKKLVVDRFNQQFGLLYDSGQIEQRLRDLRGDMQLYSEALTRSGWGRSENGNPSADDAVWTAYLKSAKNRAAKKWRRGDEFIQPLEYERLFKLWGDMMATGRGVRAPPGAPGVPRTDNTTVSSNSAAGAGANNSCDEQSQSGGSNPSASVSSTSIPPSPLSGGSAPSSMSWNERQRVASNRANQSEWRASMKEFAETRVKRHRMTIDIEVSNLRLASVQGSLRGVMRLSSRLTDDEIKFANNFFMTAPAVGAPDLAAQFNMIPLDVDFDDWRFSWLRENVLSKPSINLST